MLVAPLGDEGFAAFSPLSGESHLLNSESVAVLEALSPVRAVSAWSVCERLAHDHGQPAETLLTLLAPAWDSLVQAGLVQVETQRSGG